jgi:hypothetical protein
MPVHTQLFALFSRSIAKAWIAERWMANRKKDRALQAGWWAWVRPGALKAFLILNWGILDLLHPMVKKAFEEQSLSTNTPN